MDHERFRVLPSGRTLDLRRSRGMGALDPEELAFCRAQGVPLAYDPVQLGWVPLDCEDDLEGARMASAAAPRRASKPGNPRVEDLASELRRTLNALSKAKATESCAALVDELADRGRDGASVVELERIRAVLEQVAAELGLRGRRPTAPARSRFRLRPWAPGDVDAFMAILTNWNLWRFLPDPYPEPFTRDVAQQLIEISNASSHHEVRAVELDGTIVGQVRLSFDSHPTLRVAEVAYWLGEEHWGKGLMSELLRDYTEASFRAHALDQIHAWIHPANVGSAKAAERAGYVRNPWRHEAALASAVRRAGFHRYTAYRGAEVDSPAAQGHGATSKAEPVG